MTLFSLDAIKAAARSGGSHFFDRDTLRFFRSRMSARVHVGAAGTYFVTSEQFRPVYGTAHSRRFTVRLATHNGAEFTIGTVGEFQAYSTAAQAHAAAKRLAAGK